MSAQITVRLPDEMVARMDELVASGQARSRVAVIERALAKEFRRLTAMHDAEILATADPDRDMDTLADYGSRLALDTA